MRSAPSRRFSEDGEVEIVGVEAAGEGLESGRHGAPLSTGARGVLHGSYSAVLQTEDGQILEAHSISAGLDYPGSGPQLAELRDTGRIRFEAVTDRQAAVERVPGGLAPRGDHPRVWSPPTRWPGSWRIGRRRLGLDLLTLSGPRRQGSRRGARHVAERIAAASDGARASAPAALMPYLMGGYPDLETSVAVGEACIDGRCRPGRARRSRSPTRSPTVPVIHAAATAALDAGATVDGVFDVCTRSALRFRVVLMVYANIVLATGDRAVRGTRRRGGRRRS